MIYMVKGRIFALHVMLVVFAFVIWTAVFAVPVVAMTWDSEIVQMGIPGHWPVNYVDSLVLDSSGNPHMVYYDFTGEETGRLLYVVEGEDGAWSVETIETTGTTDPYPSLALSPSGEPHVCYFNATALIHAWLTGEGWRHEIVDTVGGMHVSSAFDSSGDLRLVYYSSTAGNRSLRYAMWNGSDWSDETIVSEANQFFSSLAVGNDGVVHIAYVNGKTGYLMYCVNEGSVWDCIEVADVGQNDGSRPGYTSIALDDVNMPAIAYYNLTSEALGYAWFERKGWQHKDVAAAKGDRASLAFDGNGLPVIAFTSDDVNVTYTWKKDEKWNFSPIVAAGRLESGGYPDLAMTADGSPRLSCRTGPHDSLEYMQPVSEPIAANFSANVTSGYAPLSVHFSDESTGGPGSWVWDFGDGEGGNDQNPDYLYTFAGAYDVSLTVSGSSGEDTLMRDGYVTVLPRASFSANVTSGTAPLAVLFTDTSTGGPDSRVWDFGDGDTSTDPACVHIYTGPGNYSVSLTVAKGDLQNTTVMAEEIAVLPEQTSPPSSSGGDGDGDTPYAIAATGDLKAGDNVTLSFDQSAVSAITFTAGERIEGIMVTLEPVDAGPSDLDGPVYQYIEATLSYAKEDALIGLTVFFDVPENWLAAEGLGAGDLVLWRYDDGTWSPLFTELIRVSGGRAYYRAFSPGFSYFAVAAGKGMTVVAAESASSVGESVEETTEPLIEEIATPPVSSAPSTAAPATETTEAQPSPAGFIVLFLSLALVLLMIRRP